MINNNDETNKNRDMYINNDSNYNNNNNDVYITRFNNCLKFKEKHKQYIPKQ